MLPFRRSDYVANLSLLHVSPIWGKILSDCPRLIDLTGWALKAAISERTSPNQLIGVVKPGQNLRVFDYSLYTTQNMLVSYIL